jgi:tRNA threonylcarbamoyladenosine biosynthesis protein TsaB
MNVLAIETSSELCSAALLTGDTVAEQEREAGQDHSSLVLPMVATLLRVRKVEFSELGGVAFGAGPGSFTGLRIACGIAQGLAAGAGVRVIGICTLEALAEEAWQAGAAGNQVVSCVDARMGEVYHAAYRREGAAWCECSPPGLYAPAAVPVLDGEWIGAGSGFAAHGSALRARQKLVAALPGLRPHARIVAMLAQPRFAAGEAVSAEHALPLYLRDKVAATTAERLA